MRKIKREWLVIAAIAFLFLQAAASQRQVPIQSKPDSKELSNKADVVSSDASAHQNAEVESKFESSSEERGMDEETKAQITKINKTLDILKTVQATNRASRYARNNYPKPVKVEPVIVSKIKVPSATNAVKIPVLSKAENINGQNIPLVSEPSPSNSVNE
jgi:hypothetical protein